MKTKLEKAILDSISKNPNNWRGVFYFNSKDPRILVPKQHPMMGWTLNYASPYSYIGLILIIFIVVGFIYFFQ